MHNDFNDLRYRYTQYINKDIIALHDEAISDKERYLKLIEETLEELKNLKFIYDGGLLFNWLSGDNIIITMNGAFLDPRN